MRFLFVAILLLLALEISAATPTAALLDLKSEGVHNKVIIDEIQMRLINILSLNDGVKVMSPRKRDSMLERKGVMIPTNCDLACKTELGKTIGTHYLIIPTLRKEGNALVIACELFNVDDSATEMIARHYVNGDIGKSLSMISQQFFKTQEEIASSKMLYIGAGVVGGIGIAGLVYYLFFSSSDVKSPERIPDTTVLNFNY